MPSSNILAHSNASATAHEILRGLNDSDSFALNLSDIVLRIMKIAEKSKRTGMEKKQWVMEVVELLVDFVVQKFDLGPSVGFILKKAVPMMIDNNVALERGMKYIRNKTVKCRKWCC